MNVKFYSDHFISIIGIFKTMHFPNILYLSFNNMFSLKTDLFTSQNSVVESSWFLRSSVELVEKSNQSIRKSQIY